MYDFLRAIQLCFLQCLVPGNEGEVPGLHFYQRNRFQGTSVWLQGESVPFQGISVWLKGKRVRFQGCTFASKLVSRAPVLWLVSPGHAACIAKSCRLSAVCIVKATKLSVEAGLNRKIRYFYFQGLGHGTVHENNSGCFRQHRQGQRYEGASQTAAQTDFLPTYLQCPE